MKKEELASKIFIGVVESNQDPKRLGRCKVRVVNVYEDDIPTEDIPWATPWKDLNGTTFNLPEVGKVVSVVFDAGNPYKPEYIFAEHYNKNLEAKLQELNDKDYLSMRAMMFDHKTQIYSNDSQGLIMDYKFNNINITKNNININLKDNFGHVNIGTADATQKAILGDNFMNWFDQFIEILLGQNGTMAVPPFLTAGSPAIASPQLISILEQYKILRDPKFLSNHVNIVDNELVEKLSRINIPQVGDSWKSTIKNNDQTSIDSIDYLPMSGNSNDTPPGQLTPYVDNVGNVLNPVDGNTPPPSILPSDNPDVIKIISAMQKKKYQILTRPYEINIVAIRRQYEGMKYSNSFKDDLYAIFRTDNNQNWTVYKFRISTMPGFYSAKESGGKLTVDKTGKSPNVKKSSVMLKRGTPPNNGLGILMPSQYLNIYAIGEHCGAPAMKAIGEQLFYRDNSPGDTIKYTGQGKGMVGMLIHRGYPGGSNVGNWSEGCQIFSSESELTKFFKICEEHKNRYGNKFHYTLMLERDL